MFALPLRGGRDGLTQARGGVLHRLIHAGEQPVLVRVAQLSPDRVLFGARAPSREAADWAIECMRLALGIDQDLSGFYDRFRFDPLIGRSVQTSPGLRASGKPDPFEALALAICAQLIDFGRAAAIQRRLIARLGRRCEWSGMRDAPTALTLSVQTPALLESMDLSAGRAVALIRAAREVASGRVDLHDPSRHERDWRRLRAISGIGSWTVQMLGLTGQGRLDQLPAGDVAYLKLVGRLRSGGHQRARDTVDQHARATVDQHTRATVDQHPRGTGDQHPRATEEEVGEFFAPYAPWAGLAGLHALRAAGSPALSRVAA